MWTKPMTASQQTGQPSGPEHDALDPKRTWIERTLGTPLVAAALALAVMASMFAGHSARAQDPDGGTAGEPGLCLEAASSLVAPEAWSEILETMAAAAERNTDFFPDATVVTMPDLTQSWDAQASPTVKIGIWSTGSTGPGSDDARRASLADAACLQDGSGWATTVSHDLVLAAAESILAGARLPQDGAEPLVPRDAEADIDVEFDPNGQLVRTVLEWSKVAFILPVGGSCWIHDVLGAEGGEVVVSSVADMDVSFGGEAGCALFQEFLHEKGAGERAIELLPTEIPLADGTILRFVVESVAIHDTEIAMSGSIEVR